MTPTDVPTATLNRPAGSAAWDVVAATASIGVPGTQAAAKRPDLDRLERAEARSAQRAMLQTAAQNAPSAAPARAAGRIQRP